MCDITKIKHVVSRDFGYVNTISLSVLKSDEFVDLTTAKLRLEAVQSKEEARHIIENNHLVENIEIVERLRLNGRNFLAKINKLCDRIDRYTSKIDVYYNELDVLKAKIIKDQALEAEQLITQEMKRNGCSVHEKVRRFFELFGKIQDLKKARRKQYRKIAALKKVWFGFVSNVEVALAQKYNAMLVREDLTVKTIEKEASDYKGRTFNKMIDNGSKGQYQNKASDNLLWNGIPEVAVPSWYTSRSCLTHSVVVDSKHRKGEKLFLPCCDEYHHADEHAADTIGGLMFLQPGLRLDQSKHCDKKQSSSLGYIGSLVL
jgi:hypothetical protein